MNLNQANYYLITGKPNMVVGKMSIFRKSDYLRDTVSITGRKDNRIISKKTKLPTQEKSKKLFCRNCNCRLRIFAKICSQCGGNRFQKTRRK